MSSYDKLRRQRIEIGPNVEWHFTKILCAIKRKLKTKQTFREPCKFKFIEPIPLCNIAASIIDIANLLHLRNAQVVVTQGSILFRY